MLPEFSSFFEGEQRHLSAASTYTWGAFVCWHRRDAVPALQTLFAQRVRLLPQRGFSPVQAELGAAVVQRVSPPTHDVKKVVRTVWLVKDAVQYAIAFAAQLRAVRAIRQPGRKAMQNPAVSQATDGTALRITDRQGSPWYRLMRCSEHFCKGYGCIV